MMKNILSLMALGSMASAWSYTVDQLELMEAMGTPIRLEADPLNEKRHYIEIKHEEDNTKWNASFDDSLLAFELSERRFYF